MGSEGFPANPIEREGYYLEFGDEFNGDRLDLTQWIPYYLPHWSSRERSVAHYSIENGALVLAITEDQEPWCPEFDGDVKCSSLQTGIYAGAVGSSAGQHRFNDACVVQEAQETQYLYTPLYGYFEARVKAPAISGSLGALWMIGREETPQESGEIAIFELFGDQIGTDESEVRYGVHPWGDPGLQDEFYRESVPFDASKFHIYAIEWAPTHIDFYVDNIQRRRITQSPKYPLQFMLGIYDLPVQGSDAGNYPWCFVVDYFRAYKPVNGYLNAD